MIWLVLPEIRKGHFFLSARDLREEEHDTANRSWQFWDILLQDCDRDVIDRRLQAAGFPPWPRRWSLSQESNFGKFANDDPWYDYQSRLHRARGRIVGAAIIAAPQAAVTELQKHSAEHRVWVSGTLPSLRRRFCTCKLIDVMAIGSFMYTSGDVDCGSDVLHAIVQKETKRLPAFDALMDACVQDPSLSNVQQVSNSETRFGTCLLSSMLRSQTNPKQIPNKSLCTLRICSSCPVPKFAVTSNFPWVRSQTI